VVNDDADPDALRRQTEDLMTVTPVPRSVACFGLIDRSTHFIVDASAWRTEARKGVLQLAMVR